VKISVTLMTIVLVMDLYEHKPCVVNQGIQGCGRKALLYFAWSRPAETGEPLAIIEDRFPAVFELRRLFYPKFEHLSDQTHVDQGIGGFFWIT
jgi:hypothetical protein